MGKLRNYTNGVEAFLHSDAGQRFFNIAYSVGAAIVIWGALFKILHIPGGNALLCVGMGTEILMFILTAFDRPPKEPNWEEIIPAARGKEIVSPVESLTILDDTPNFKNRNLIDSEEQFGPVSGIPESTGKFIDSLEKISVEMAELQEAISSGTQDYLKQISDLNRNLAGINSIYELQLKNISGQLSSMDGLNNGLRNIKDMYEKSASDSERYCEETEKMTQYMKQINEVYAKMISAMKV